MVGASDEVLLGKSNDQKTNRLLSEYLSSQSSFSSSFLILHLEAKLSFPLVRVSLCSFTWTSSSIPTLPRTTEGRDWCQVGPAWRPGKDSCVKSKWFRKRRARTENRIYRMRGRRLATWKISDREQKRSGGEEGSWGHRLMDHLLKCNAALACSLVQHQSNLGEAGLTAAHNKKDCVCM